MDVAGRLLALHAEASRPVNDNVTSSSHVPQCSLLIAAEEHRDQARRSVRDAGNHRKTFTRRRGHRVVTEGQMIAALKVGGEFIARASVSNELPRAPRPR